MPKLKETTSEAKPPENAGSTLFVHRFLDDFGLGANEFRVYAHLSRRAGKSGRAWPGMRSIAEACSLTRNTVAVALDGLTQRRMLMIEKGPRNSNIYLLTPPADWLKILTSRKKADRLKHSATTGSNNEPANGSNFEPQGNPSDNPVKEIHAGALSHSLIEDSGGEVNEPDEAEILAAYPREPGHAEATLKIIRGSLQSEANEPEKADASTLLRIVKQFAKRMRGSERYVPDARKWFAEKRWMLPPAKWGGTPVSHFGIGNDPNRQIPFNAHDRAKKAEPLRGAALGRKYGVG